MELNVNQNHHPNITLSAIIVMLRDQNIDIQIL